MLLPFVYLAMLAGPSVASLLLTGLVNGKAGFRELVSRLLKWRVGARWYTAALLTAPLLMTAIPFALSLISAVFLPGIVTTDDKASFLLVGIVAGLLVGFFEELGWTGFAVPRLTLGHGVLATGLIVGLLHGAWHFPVFSGAGSSGALSPALVLPVQLFSFLPAFRVLMVWVYDRTGSLLVAMLMHVSLTASTLIFQPVTTGAPLVIYDLVLGAALWGIVAAVVVANGPAARTTTAPESGGVKEAGRRRTLRVAAIQMIAAPGEAESNRARAEKLVEQAASDGAALVVLPEMFAPGYLASRGVWDLAEPLGRGPTVAWLQRTARRFGIHVAGGLVETDGRDFFDTFVVCTPAGEIAGRACKANAESYVFLRGRGAHIVDTSLGRLGIAICADNQFVPMPSFFHAHAVDLVLMPHAWPIPRVARGIVKAHDVREQLEHVRSLPVLYATLLGVPVVFANLTGPFAPVPGVLGRLLDPAVFAMGGQSRVVDSDGIVRASLDSGDGVAAADVALDPALKRLGEIPNHRGWLFPGSRVARELLMPIDIAWGRLSYTLSRSRAHTARELMHHVAKESVEPARQCDAGNHSLNERQTLR